MITSLKPNEIIVVGTNLNGNHYGGAAAQAHRDFGLEWGCAEGLSGQTYAFPTLDKDMKKQPREYLEQTVKNLYAFCKAMPESTFLLTAVGTGIAGYSHEEMKSLFTDLPKNLVLPEEWK